MFIKEYHKLKCQRDTEHQAEEVLFQRQLRHSPRARLRNIGGIKQLIILRQQAATLTKESI
jgi:ribonuclease P protein component